MTAEVLSKILEIEIIRILDDTDTHPELVYFSTSNIEIMKKNSPFMPSISKFELVYLCKAWTVRNSGWTLQSYTNERGAGICRVKVGDGQEINKLIGTSEVDAVFKATEWVYAELKKRGNK